MSFENSTNNFEQTPRPKVEVEHQYADFVPEEFKNDPLGYFEREGVNIKSGEIQRNESGEIKEDPTAVKDLPVWTKAGGETLETVGKRINVEKSQVGKSGDPFYEYKIMEIAQEFALPAPRPVAKAEQDDKHLIIMEKVQGIRWTERDMRAIHESDLTEADKQDMLKQAEEKMRRLEQKFSSIGLNRTWKIKDMIADVAIEDKAVMSLTPTDWERAKIDQTKLTEAREMIASSVAELRGQLRNSIVRHLNVERERESTDERDPDKLVDMYMQRMIEDGSNGKDYLELAAYMKALSQHQNAVDTSKVYPTFFTDSFDDWVRGKNIFANEKMTSSYVWNHTLRTKEKIESQPARMEERLMRDILASEDEANAGVYREELEPQVSDAVFALRKKGYDTFQSGFDDLADGSQFLDFNLEEKVHDPDALKAVFEEEQVKNLLEKDHIHAEAKIFKDRLTLKFTPKNPHTTLEEWKKVFDSFAEALPDRGQTAPPPTRLGSYETFLERQKKLRSGEKTYLGYGLEFDGKSVFKRS